MTKYLLGAASALALSLPVAAAAQQLSPAVIAVVDTDRVFTECTACRTAQTQLQTQGQQLQQRAQQLGTPLQSEGQAIQTAVNALGQNAQPDAALQTRIRTFQTQQETAQREIATRQETLQRNVAFVRQQIGQAINQVLPAVIQARGATIAMDRSATLAINPSVDVTNDVLAQVNQRLTTINTNAPPPQQQPAAAGQPARPATTTPPAQQNRPRGR